MKLHVINISSNEFCKMNLKHFVSAFIIMIYVMGQHNHYVKLPVPSYLAAT